MRLVPGPCQAVTYALSPDILLKRPFSSEETEHQGGRGACLRSHSKEEVELGLEWASSPEPCH